MWGGHMLLKYTMAATDCTAPPSYLLAPPLNLLSQGVQPTTRTRSWGFTLLVPLPYILIWSATNSC